MNDILLTDEDRIKALRQKCFSLNNTIIDIDIKEQIDMFMLNGLYKPRESVENNSKALMRFIALNSAKTMANI